MGLILARNTMAQSFELENFDVLLAASSKKL